MVVAKAKNVVLRLYMKS